MTISIRSSFMKRHCINVTGVSDVSERHRDTFVEVWMTKRVMFFTSKSSIADGVISY